MKSKEIPTNTKEERKTPVIIRPEEVSILDKDGNPIEVKSSKESAKVVSEINESSEKLKSLDKKQFSPDEQEDIENSIEGFEEKEDELKKKWSIKIEELGAEMDRAEANNDEKRYLEIEAERKLLQKDLADEKARREILKKEEVERLGVEMDKAEADRDEKRYLELEAKKKLLQGVDASKQVEQKVVSEEKKETPQKKDDAYEEFSKESDKELEEAEARAAEQEAKKENSENSIKDQLMENPLIAKVEDLRDKEDMLRRDLEYKKKHLGDFGFTEKDIEKAEKRLEEAKAEHRKALDEAGLDRDIQFELNKFDKKNTNSWFNRKIASLREKYPNATKKFEAFNAWRKKHPYLYQVVSFGLTATIGLGFGAAAVAGTGVGAGAILAAGFAGAKTSVALRALKMPIGMVSGWVGSKVGAATHEVLYTGKYEKQHETLKKIEELMDGKGNISPKVRKYYEERIAKSRERVEENRLAKKNLFKAGGALVGVGGFIGFSYAGGFDSFNAGVREVVAGTPTAPEGGVSTGQGGGSIEESSVTEKEGTQVESKPVYEAPKSAIIQKGEGITHAYLRQLQESQELCDALGIKGAPTGADAARLAMQHGYINPDGSDVRVFHGQGAAYDLELVDGKVEVIESKNNLISGSSSSEIMERNGIGRNFESNLESYEYINKGGNLQNPEVNFEEASTSREVEAPEDSSEQDFKEPLFKTVEPIKTPLESQEQNLQIDIDESGLEKEPLPNEAVQEEDFDDRFTGDWKNKAPYDTYFHKENTVSFENLDEQLSQPQKLRFTEQQLEQMIGRDIPDLKGRMVEFTQEELNAFLEKYGARRPYVSPESMHRVQETYVGQRVAPQRQGYSFFGGLWRSAVRTATNSFVGGFFGTHGVHAAGGIDVNVNHGGNIFKEVGRAVTGGETLQQPGPANDGGGYYRGTEVGPRNGNSSTGGSRYNRG